MSTIRALKRTISLQCKHKSNEKDGSKVKDVERKSLVPRLVYLSTHGCASFLRESESNGASSDVTASGEMKTLLEKYARSIGYSFDDALSVVLGISSGKKAVKVNTFLSWLYYHTFFCLYACYIIVFLKIIICIFFQYKLMLITFCRICYPVIIVSFLYSLLKVSHYSYFYLK